MHLKALSENKILLLKNHFRKVLKDLRKIRKFEKVKFLLSKKTKFIHKQ
jgi:hypothetical protein